MTQKQHNQLLAEVQKVLLDDPNFLRSLLSLCLQQIVNDEFTNFIGAEKNERSDERTSYRNGSYERSLKTRVGPIDLSVCRDREGLFQTELFHRYQRNERALVSTMVEMYINGVSTRKVSKVVEALCGCEVSKSQISELAKGLDETLTAWRKRRLDTDYPYLVVDARYEKIRTPDFQGTIWQRCQVHFIRNFMSKLKWKDLDKYLPDLKEIFAATSKEESIRRKTEFVIKLEKTYPDIAEWIDENIEFSLSVYALPSGHRKRMKSTNMIERLNKELKRRSRVIGIFPNDAACLRVLGTICQETYEEWEVGKKYLNMEVDYRGNEEESIKLSRAS